MASETLDRDVATRLHADQRYTKGRRRLVAVLGDGGGPMTIQEILDTDGEAPEIFLTARQLDSPFPCAVGSY